MQNLFSGIVNQLKDTWCDFSSINSIMGDVIVLITVFLYIIFSIIFKKHVNRQSNQQILSLIQNGKYIPELYIELNTAAEQLRYFARPSKFRKKLISDFNKLFDNTASQRINRTIDDDLIIHLDMFSSYGKIQRAIENNYNVFEHYRGTGYDENNKIGEFHFIVQFSSFYYQNRLNELLEYCKVATRKNIILSGSAGNGKTNLLCEFSKMTISTGNVCAFVEARKIKSICTKYFESQYFTKDFHILQATTWLRLQNILLFIVRKYLIIVIDALNENDNEIFISSVKEFNDQYAKYKRVKILYSCRSEYFDIRYRKLFKDAQIAPYVLNLSSTYDIRAKEHMLNTYKKYFKFEGTIQGLAKERLFASLLLMRIFFEVYRNEGNLSITQLNNWAIYKKYIDIISKQAAPLQFDAIITHIVNLMIKSDDYESIKLQELNLSSTDKILFENSLDNNFLITKKIMLREGTLTEETDEQIYFVFDELRDYCISRYQLSYCENCTPNNYLLFYQYVDQLVVKQKSPAEGVIKYSYCHFKAQRLYKECKKILVTYGKTRFQESIVRYETKPPFSYFGIMIILSSSEELLQFEIRYFAVISLHSDNEWKNLLKYALKNERQHNQHGADLMLRVIFDMVSVDSVVLKERVSNLFQHQPYSYKDQIFSDKYQAYLDEIIAEEGHLSVGLSQLTLLLHALDTVASNLFSVVNDIISSSPSLADALISDYKETKIITDLEFLKTNTLTSSKSIK